MKIKALFIALALMLGATAQAQGLGDLLNGLGGSSSNGDNGLGSTISNVLSGVFAKSDLTLEDIVGEYVSDGPAVSFKSDNFLQKAGGIAGAAALETKLQPYYEQYGLIGMPLTIDNDGNFSLTIKGVKLSGTVEAKDNKGEFKFTVMIAGTIKVGKFTAYIMKSGKNIDLMFDATKLKDLISTVGKFTGQKIVSSMTKLLDSYDGANIGFKMKYTGSGQDSSTPASSDAATDSVGSGASGEGSGLDNLFNILNSRKK